MGGERDVFFNSWGGGSNQRHNQDPVLGWGERAAAGGKGFGGLGHCTGSCLM